MCERRENRNLRDVTEPDDGVSDLPAARCRHHYFFFDVDLRDVFRDEVLREPPLRELLRDGTLAPFFRDSFNAIAMACLRLFTFLPEPLFSVPFFRRRIADSTFFEAARPYFAIFKPPA